MFELIRPGTQIDFAGKKNWWLGISFAAILITFVLFFTKGLNYGIDFTGGTEIQIQVLPKMEIGTVRQLLSKGGILNSKVQQIGEPDQGQFLLKIQGDEASLEGLAQQIETIFHQYQGTAVEKGLFEIQRRDIVGPAAGSSLRMSGFLSLFYVLVCILVYVTFRFDYRYSPGAVIALLHDAIITIGILIATEKQFDLQILAALLALIGYSNNDTIIVFDRIREVVQNFPKLSMEQAVNRAVNETLGRTLLTSISTWITVFALWVFGGKVIEDFAFTLMMGLIVGTYSSIFIASSLVILMTQFSLKHKKAN